MRGPKIYKLSQLTLTMPTSGVILWFICRKDLSFFSLPNLKGMAPFVQKL